MKTISIIIVNYNGQRFLERLCKSIELQTFRDFEIIFVDNGSKDNSLRFIREKFPDVITIQSENKGYGTSCNIGFNSAKGEYLIFLNEDMYLPKNFFEKMLEFRRKLQNQNIIGAISCKMVDFDADPEDFNPTHGAKMDIFGFPIKNKRANDIFIVSGSPLFISRNLFNRVKGFNENIFLYGEDVDLSWRLKIFGYNNYVCHTTHIFHFGGGATGSFGPSKIANNIFSSWIPIFTNYHWMTLIIIIPFYLIYILTAITAVLFFKKMDLSYACEIYKKYKYFFGNMKKIWRFRKFVQNRRTRSDYFVLKYISLLPAFVVNSSYRKLLPGYIIKNY